jgi:hypothetical protein
MLRVTMPDGSPVATVSSLAEIAALRAGGFIPESATVVEAETVPQSVKLWQARAMLRTAGKLDAATAAIAASGNAALQDAWEYAPDISRASPAVAALGAALNLSPEQIDALFIAASKLTV